MSDLVKCADPVAALTEDREPTGPTLIRHSRAYRCRCGNPLFFANTLCLNCRSQLGYLPDEGRIRALDPGPGPDTWHADGRAQLLKSCGNRASASACNWMLLASNPAKHCVACRLNRAIPDLTDPDNVRYWRDIEGAKRRLVSQLLALGLPVRSKVDEDPECGVMFDFLRSPKDGPRVITGHDNGLITINVEEADDAKREAIREKLHEPYRTLLGHFRHEIAHYYWEILIQDSKWLEPFRQLFGDERASYADACTRHYKEGPPADWATSHISSYSTMHPWEDWAECWAHYMHAVDGLGTATGYGVDLERDEGRVRQFGRDALYAPDDPFAEAFLRLLNSWLRLGLLLNELARSMDAPDFYPFVMSAPVVAKLQFVQMVVADARADAEL